MKHTLEALKAHFPYLLNKAGVVVFITICLLIASTSCKRGNNSSNSANEQQATANGNVDASTSSNTESGDQDASQSDDQSGEELASDDATDGNQELTESSTDFEWQDLGKATYNSCLACHQANGEGLAGAFPPLKGHITDLYQAEGGRKYLINVVIFGLQGKIDVKGTSYNSAMASHNFLSDEQIAAVLNHELNSWGNDELLANFSPILPEEIASERGNGLNAREVLELRPNLQ